MASGHVNRTNRPNTWLHRPATQREDSSCQLGAVHTWHIADLAKYSVDVCHREQSGRLSGKPPTSLNDAQRSLLTDRCISAIRSPPPKLAAEAPRSICIVAANPHRPQPVAANPRASQLLASLGDSDSASCREVQGSRGHPKLNLPC
jgi:hypothetical protein